MSKKSENNISTERILKSKYLDKDKQITIPLIKHKPSAKKVRLTDLCPEEKLKIGQLIKALDQRKSDNEQLTAQLKELVRDVQQLRIDLNTSRLQSQNIKSKYQEKKAQVSSLNDQISHLKQALSVQALKNMELSRTSEEYFKKLSQMQQEKVCIAIQASSQSTDYSIQTVPAVKDTGIQTQKQENERDLFYRPHSKPFEKIMKAPVSVQLRRTAEANQSYQTSKNKSSHSKGKLSLTDKHSPHELIQDEECQELNQKWDRLKVKHQRGRVDWQASPHSFHVTTEVQKQSSRKKNSNMNEIDEVALNRMLRLKNFSASKLMRAGKEVTSQKKKQQSPQVNYIKSPYFNRADPDIGIQVKAPRQASKSHMTSENQINFYDSSIFEVESEQKR